MLFSKQKTRYTSEFTQFLTELKETHPHLEQQQREGRARLWDKEPTTLDDQRRIFESTVSKSSH